MQFPLAIVHDVVALDFPGGWVASEQILLRWTHVTAGIIWIGLLYFLNLVATPASAQLGAEAREKLVAAVIGRVMWWYRWAALVTVLAGLRYFWQMLVADAVNDGSPELAWEWLGEWFGVWLVAYALIYWLQMPHRGLFDNGWLRAILIGGITLLAMGTVLELQASEPASSNHLAIAAGGGLGLVMLLNAWGVIWRAHKRLLFWSLENAERGTPLPERARFLERWSFLASRTAFWMSFPMLFFMVAAGHYPFLYSISR